MDLNSQSLSFLWVKDRDHRSRWVGWFPPLLYEGQYLPLRVEVSYDEKGHWRWRQHIEDGEPYLCPQIVNMALFHPIICYPLFHCGLTGTGVLRLPWAYHSHKFLTHSNLPIPVYSCITLSLADSLTQPHSS